jgi:hypothetical protein
MLVLFFLWTCCFAIYLVVALNGGAEELLPLLVGGGTVSQ